MYTPTMQSSGTATVICDGRYINPKSLEGDLNDNQDSQESGDQTQPMGSRRRRKRSTIKRTLRNKRQDVGAPTKDLSENITFVSLMRRDFLFIPIARSTAFVVSELYDVRSSTQLYQYPMQHTRTGRLQECPD